MTATDHNNTLSGGDVETLLVGLLLTALIAVFAWFGCRAAGRPDWGAAAGAFIVIVGAILTLLAVL